MVFPTKKNLVISDHKFCLSVEKAKFVILLHFSLLNNFAGYVVFELYEYNNRFKLHEQNFNELQSQGKILKNENEALRLEINRLQHQQELSKVKIKSFNTDLKNRDDFLKDIDKGARLFHE